MNDKIEFVLFFLLGFVLGLVLLANDAARSNPPSSCRESVADIMLMSSGLRINATQDPDYDSSLGYPDHIYFHTGGINTFKYAALRRALASLIRGGNESGGVSTLLTFLEGSETSGTITYTLLRQIGC